MKKMSLSLLTAATVAIGAISFAAPAHAATATAITPQLQYKYVWYHFTSYPPTLYTDDNTNFQGRLVKVVQNADGTYEGEYYGTTEI